MSAQEINQRVEEIKKSAEAKNLRISKAQIKAQLVLQTAGI